MDDRFVTWAAKLTGVEHSDDTRRETAVTVLSRILSQPRESTQFEQFVAAVGQQFLVESSARPEFSVRIDEILNAPEVARLPAEVVNTLRYYRLGASMLSTISGRKRINDEERAAFASKLFAFANEPDIASDRLLVATAKITGAQIGRSKELSPQGIEAMRQVANDDRLGPHDRLRQFALLSLANAAAAKNDLAGAQSYFQRTGLSEQQCAVLGPKPGLRRSGVGSEDFPNEALAYGFEGWVRLEFDITADGKTAGTRAVIAYPPFVFVDAATKMSSNMRYETSYRPGGSVACSANNSMVRFVLGQ